MVNRAFRSLAVIGVALVVFRTAGADYLPEFSQRGVFSPTAHLSFEAYRYVLSRFRFSFRLRHLAVSFPGHDADIGSAGKFVGVSARADRSAGKKMARALAPRRRSFSLQSVLAFGYVVAVGSGGFFRFGPRRWIGRVPWNLYSLFGLVLIAGSDSRVPRVSLCLFGAAQPQIPAVEEAARVAGAGLWRIALTSELAFGFTVDSL